MRGKKTRVTMHSAALYLLILALALKAMLAYSHVEPSRDSLMPVSGEITELSLGGDGKPTWIKLAADKELPPLYTYYGRVWPEMRGLKTGMQAEALIEEPRLKRPGMKPGDQFFKLFWVDTYDKIILVNSNRHVALKHKSDTAKHFFLNVLGLRGKRLPNTLG